MIHPESAPTFPRRPRLRARLILATLVALAAGWVYGGTTLVSAVVDLGGGSHGVAAALRAAAVLTQLVTGGALVVALLAGSSWARVVFWTWAGALAFVAAATVAHPGVALVGALGWLPVLAVPPLVGRGVYWVTAAS
jgi:hypothetical protein